MKLWNFVAAALFAGFAALQFNDPDPVYWILVYGGTAMVAFAQGLGRHSRFWTGVCVGVVVVGIISAAPGFGDYLTSGDPGSILGDMAGGDYVENSREFLGLALAFILLATYSIKNSQSRW